MNEQTKHILISIFVGACISFLSTLFEGLVNLLQSHAGNVAGIAGGMLTYSTKIKSITPKTTPYSPV